MSVKYFHLKVKEIVRETPEAITIHFWHPLSEQIKLADGELAARLLALPDLPPVFIKAVGKKIETAARNNTVEPNRDHNGEKSGGSNDSPLEVNGLGALAAQRKAITAAQFTEVVVRQGCCCYWCGIRVVRVSQIPATNRMLKNGRTILYYVGDELREEAVGTIDHLL